jgi:hypothetical protein
VASFGMPGEEAGLRFKMAMGGRQDAVSRRLPSAPVKS